MNTRMIGSPLTIAPDPARASAIAEHNAKYSALEPADVLDGPEHLIYGARQEGKTTLALKWMTDAPEGVKRCLIVPTVAIAQELALSIGLRRNDPRIISVRQLQSGGPDPDTEYGIDDTAWILTNLLGLRETPRLLTICTAADWQGTPTTAKEHR